MKNKIKLLNDKLSISLFNLNIFHFIFFIFIFNLYISVLYSQTPKLIGPPSSAIDIHINQQDPSIIYASNFNGGLFNTNNYGNTYRAVETNNANYWIYQIFYSKENQNLFLYLGYDLVKGDLNGLNWKLINNDLNYGPYPKYFIVNPLNENVMYMYRHGKEIWRSNDNGENWYLLHTFDDDFERIAISPTDTSILYAAIGNDLYKSTDSGKNWFKPFDISFASSAENLVVNPQNPHSVYLESVTRLIKAVDNGKNVDTILYNVVDFIIDPKDSLTMYVTLYPGGVIKSIDGCQSWFDINNGLPDNGTTVNKLAIDPINTNIVYASTSKGIYKTIDGGENWEFINLVNDGGIYNYEVINGEEGEIIFLSGSWHVVKTKDFGNTWIKSIFEPQENSWDMNTFSMAFNPQDKNYGYLGDGTDLFKTTDGGSTWIKTDDVPGSLTIVYNKYSPKIIYILTADERLYVTEDGGNSWIELPGGYFPPIVFSPEDEKVGFYPTSNGIYKTTNMGRTWQFFDEGYPVSQGIIDFDVVENNPSVVYGAARGYYMQVGALLKSLDGGESWFRVDSTLIELEPMTNVRSVCIDQENPNRLFVGVNTWGPFFHKEFTTGGLYLTEDDCKTWRKIFDSPVNKIKIDYTTEPNTIYFTTKFGLMSLPDTAHVTDIKKLTEIPKRFELFQNYPNPFNPTTTIQYSLKESGIVKLNVFNILGEEIKILVNKFQEKGNYSISFDASNLPSGVYFYKLQSGKYTQVNKMILLR